MRGKERRGVDKELYSSLFTISVDAEERTKIERVCRQVLD